MLSEYHLPFTAGHVAPAIRCFDICCDEECAILGTRDCNIWQCALSLR